MQALCLLGKSNPSSLAMLKCVNAYIIAVWIKFFPLPKDIENLPACTIFVGFYSKFNDDLVSCDYNFCESLAQFKANSTNQIERGKSDGRTDGD